MIGCRKFKTGRSTPTTTTQTITMRVARSNFCQSKYLNLNLS